MRIRIFLIILIILSFLGGVGSTIAFSRHEESVKVNVILVMITIYVMNLICAFHLFNKSNNNKIEWALFGFLENITAIMVYCAKNYITSRWEKEKSILKN